MKIHYSRPEFHYEAWHHTGVGRLEVGLHFEGTSAENKRAFEFFRSQVLAVKAQLPRAELEPWDRGWSRIYETIPAPQLDGVVLDPAATLMTSYIVTLQPLVELLVAD